MSSNVPTEPDAVRFRPFAHQGFRRAYFATLVGLFLLGCRLPKGNPMADLLVLAVMAGLVLHAPLAWARHCVRRKHRHYELVLEPVLRAARREPLASSPPKVLGTKFVPAGLVLALRVPLGASVLDFERLRPELPAAFGVRDVTCARDLDNAGIVYLRLVRGDPFARAARSSPLAQVLGPIDFTRPLPLGVDESGQLVATSLLEHHLLLGGEPGAGKSNALSLVVAAAALDPSVKLYLLDGKFVELGPWCDVADRFCGNEIDEAVELLEQVRAEMEGRYVELRQLKRRKVTPGDGLCLHVVVCDELAFFLNHPDKKRAQRFGDLLRDLVARGRAAGVVVVAATQKPAADVVPSALRDLFGYRWAMRCATREASDTILGSGWAAQGYSAADLDAAVRGVGLLRHEGAAPVKLRAFHLSDHEVEAIAMRAERLRREYCDERHRRRRPRRVDRRRARRARGERRAARGLRARRGALWLVRGTGPPGQHDEVGGPGDGRAHRIPRHLLQGLWHAAKDPLSRLCRALPP